MRLLLSKHTIIELERRESHASEIYRSLLSSFYFFFFLQLISRVIILMTPIDRPFFIVNDLYLQTTAEIRNFQRSLLHGCR